MSTDLIDPAESLDYNTNPTKRFYLVGKINETVQEYMAAKVKVKTKSFFNISISLPRIFSLMNLFS